MGRRAGKPEIESRRKRYLCPSLLDNIHITPDDGPSSRKRQAIAQLYDSDTMVALATMHAVVDYS
jgi:hypothetical protein